MRASPFLLQRSLWILCGMIGLATCTNAHAAWLTDLASAFDKKSIFNIDLRAGYTRTLKRGTVKRELSGRSTNQVEIVNDLEFSQVRHILSLRNDYTLFKAIQIYLEFPIILSDTRWLDFATPGSSTLARDGFINSSAMSPGQAALAGPDPVPGGFKLPRRSGIDQMYIGLAGSPMSQERDPTKPTWVLGFEARIAVGDHMEYNPYFNPAQPESALNPKGNSAVGRGVHEYKWFTTISRRYKYLDPWMTFFYLLPDAKQKSLFGKTTFDLSGQERSGPQQRGGTEFGLEIIPYERPRKEQRVSIEIGGHLEGVFEGRGYSEMWEIFANSSILAGPCRSVTNSMFPQSWNNGNYCAVTESTIPFPGITSIENYATFGGSLAVNAEVTRYFRARIGVALGHEQAHFITFGDAGKARVPNQPIDLNDERQVNPMFRPYIDMVGRRFRIEETTLFDFFVSAAGQF